MPRCKIHENRQSLPVKKMLLKVIVIITIAIVAFCIICSAYMRVYINSFNDVKITYNYLEKQINAVIVDENDILELKDILNGVKYRDDPSCGFSADISVTFSKGNESITFCPALDGCSVVRINNSSMYIKISDEKRQRFNEIMGKYGMTFPCI